MESIPRSRYSHYEHNLRESDSNVRFSKITQSDRVLNFKKASDYEKDSESGNKPGKKSIFARAYVAIKKCVAYRAFKINMLFGYIVCEPIEVLRRIIPAIKGMKNNFTSYGLNNRTIRSHEVPLIMAHGDALNQGVWTHLGKALKDKNAGPGFTVNLPGDTDKRVNALLDRIYEVVNYGDSGSGPVYIDLCGHSRGVFNVLDVILELPENIKVRNFYLLGMPIGGIQYHYEREPYKLKHAISMCKGKVFSYCGGCDPLKMYAEMYVEKYVDKCAPEFKVNISFPSVIVDTSGHLGLLTHKRVLNQIVELRRENSTTTG